MDATTNGAAHEATVWTDEFLASMRHVGDVWADGLVDKVIAEAGSEEAGDKALLEILGTLVRIHDSVPEGLPEEWNTLFLTKDQPAWVDMQKVALGEKVFAEHIVEIVVVLLFSSLPVCYACSPGVNALAITQQITTFVTRRIIETARFILAVMQPGNLSADGYGTLTAKKIRMIHAVNRHILLTHPQAQWQEAEWGKPLNQEDQAGTLMTFCVTVLDNLTKSHIPLSHEEQEAYYHAWRYIGYLMGTREDLLPATYAEGQAMLKAITDRLYAPSESGRLVTKALVDFLREILPGTKYDGYVPSKIRFYVGDEVGDMLGVDKADWTMELIKLHQLLHGIEERLLGEHTPLSRVTKTLGLDLINGLEDYFRVDNRPAFHIPDGLRTSVGIRTE